MEASGYRPQPRWGHASITVGSKVYMWGGRTEAFSEEEKEELKKLIEVFDASKETWSQHKTAGPPPPGLYNNAHTALGTSLYFYGGYDGKSSFDALHQLETLSLIWKEISASNPWEAPKKISGCGMVAYGDHKLVLFGGFVASSEEGGQQPGSTYFRRADGTDEKVERGWVNELRVFDLHEKTWSTPTTTGSSPPPCVDFTFTLIDSHRAVLFGGYQPETGSAADAYMIDMDTWHWTKLGPNDAKDLDTAASPLSSWPKGRDGHTACLLAGEPRPLLLVSGGWDKDDHALSDAWILDVNREAWKELDIPVEVGHRFWHSMVVINYSLRLKQLLYFGGCPGNPDLMNPESGDWPKIASTVILELGQLVVGEQRREWVVMEALTEAQLGDPMRRLREKVLMAEYRAVRAEELALEAMKKLQALSFVRELTPTPSEDSDIFLPPTQSRKTKAEMPFWVISREELELTHKEIGRGRWTSVQVATYRGSQVAARSFLSQLFTEDSQKVFIECMDLAAKLRHPNLVPFIGAVVDSEVIVVTELMPTNLKAVLEKGPLAKHEVISIGMGVAKGLHFLHSCKPKPFTHGELTSTSVLLEHERGVRWKAKLSDFMTAKFIQSASPSFDFSSSVTSPIRSPLGAIGKSVSLQPSSPVHPKRRVSMPATPASESTQASQKHDVYLYGLLLLEMATQSSPLEVSMAYLLESTTIKWPEVSKLIKSCIEAEPSSRPEMADIIPTLKAMDSAVFVKT